MKITFRSDMKLEFKSYDGEYPNLCGGKLILVLDGSEVIFPDHCLSSGGNVWFDEFWNECIMYGEWYIDEYPDGFPEELKEEVENLVNLNIPFGCCGGCI